MKIKKIGIVSLSSGILGEKFIEHEVNIGLKRLENYGIEVTFLPNSRKGIEYLQKHPEARAEDLLNAFKDESIDMILCAIGGDDTYRLLPYLFEHNELRKAAKQKVFLGFSDTTINHFMLNRIGIKSFYGQAFLPDICELSCDMLEYTKKYFEELICTGKIRKITPSLLWYEERKDFSEASIGVNLKSFPNQGFELLRGSSFFEGEILGGCIDSIYDIFNNSRYADSVDLCKKYNLFPSLEEWKDKILLIETSEELPTPNLYKQMIQELQDYGLFNVLNGVIVGKPQNNIYYEEYKKILLDVITNEELPIVYNINVGHATPRCIIPFGIKCSVDVCNQVITFD